MDQPLESQNEAQPTQVEIVYQPEPVMMAPASISESMMMLTLLELIDLLADFPIAHTGTGLGYEDLDYDYDDMYYEDDDDFPSPEEAYEDYVAAMNARTLFMDVRKQETRDYEKDNTHRKKRRAAKLSKKAAKSSAKQEDDGQHDKQRKRQSKKSGRRGTPGGDIVVC